jgi:hypothetical protein
MPQYPWQNNIQSVPEGNVNILGGHTIGHSKQKGVYVHVTYSERFTEQIYFTVQYTVHCTIEQHAMTSYQLQSVLMLTTNFSKMYYTRSAAGIRSRYSEWLWAGRLRGRGSSPGKVKNFLPSTSSRPVLGSTQPPIQWVPGALSPGVKRRDMKLTTPS